MGIIGVMVFFWGRDRKQTADALERRFEDLEREIRDTKQAVQTRAEQSSKEASKFWSTVQVIIGRLDRMPDDLRDKFLPLDVWEATSERRKRSRASGE